MSLTFFNMWGWLLPLDAFHWRNGSPIGSLRVVVKRAGLTLSLAHSLFINSPNLTA
jgi:hypothetical protein